MIASGNFNEDMIPNCWIQHEEKLVKEMWPSNYGISEVNLDFDQFGEDIAGKIVFVCIFFVSLDHVYEQI